VIPRVPRTFAVLALAGLILNGCAFAPQSTTASRTWLAAGTTLNEVGLQFRQTADLYNALYTARKISTTEYQRFVEFAKDFQALYPVAVQSYKDSLSAADAQKAIEAILALKSRLLEFYLTAQGVR
jgi:hypothetical protein